MSHRDKRAHLRAKGIHLRLLSAAHVLGQPVRGQSSFKTCREKKAAPTQWSLVRPHSQTRAGGPSSAVGANTSWSAANSEPTSPEAPGLAQSVTLGFWAFSTHSDPNSLGLMVLGAVETQVREVELTGKSRPPTQARKQDSSARKAFLSAAHHRGTPSHPGDRGELEGDTARQSRGNVPAHLPQRYEVNHPPARWLNSVCSLVIC